MILTESNFNRIKDKESYKVNFNNYQTVEEFNNYVKDTLEVENINILINNIIRIINIINERDEYNTELEIKELILKANLSENSEKLKEVLSFLKNSSDIRIIKINRIFDDKLLNKLDDKINLLIKIEKMCEYFYSDFSDKLVMQSFKEVLKEKNTSIENKKRTIDYSALNITEFCQELTDSQKNSLIGCLLKDKIILDKVKNFLDKTKNFFKKKDGK